MNTNTFLRIGSTIALAAAAIFCTQVPALAQQSKTKTAKTVAAAVKDMEFIAYNAQEDSFSPATPNPKAKHYIFIQSASWCAPCRKKMPEVVEAYKEMKKSGRVEIILFGWDSSQEGMQDFVKSFKAEFPAVLRTDSLVETIPGYKLANGIPDMIIVDAKGKVINKDFSDIKTWKTAVKKR